MQLEAYETRLRQLDAKSGVLVCIIAMVVRSRVASFDAEISYLQLGENRAHIEVE